jgi:WD40 repeat protein/serine/threonine protein kinase
VTDQTLEQLFNAAAELKNPVQRAAFLDAACGQNQQLRAEIEGLLRHDQAAGRFLVEPAASLCRPVAEGPGAIIGPYKLLQQIGEGGFGVVFMAEQTRPVQRKVALKILKPGMDTSQVVARFEAERQALALMDHPNIAKVLDAGPTESGRPYFVMELVKGVPITHFCDDNRLTPRERLELFIPVCQAIQHAHQKGIIHRDLKPSNVLVALYDDQMVPKVIDFGVAKAISQKLTERTLFTAFGSFIGTLQYMSPEQAKLNALDIDTRSDIYALGVLLYELLTGSTPLEDERLKQTAVDELLRIIREEEPPKPSTRLSHSGEALATISARRGTEPARMGQVLRGELDWIVMKALEKDRARRYETANGLAKDVERYLKDEPVEACPPTTGYKLRKFARKHQTLLATAAGFVALLLFGATASTWQAVRATKAETVALVNEQKANANAVRAQDKEQEANQQRNEAQQQRDLAQRHRDEVRALNDRLQRNLYASDMNLAQHAWEAGGAALVRDLLERHIPGAGETDLRDFEWHYLNRLCHAELLTLRHTDVASSVAFSPDGKFIASGSASGGDHGVGGVKVWDAQTCRELLSFKLYENAIGVRSLAFSPDGKRLATANEGPRKPVIVWDAQTGHELLSIPGGFKSVVFSPDGQRLASGFLPGAKVWDAKTGRELLTLKAQRRSFCSVAFSPDGKCLAGGDAYGAMKVWDARTGQQLLSLKGHSGDVRSLVFSPDGKRLASASDDYTAMVWDAQTGQEILSLKQAAGGVRRLAFSPDGKRLAGASFGNGVKVWDAQTGEELLAFSGHSDEVLGLAFSPDGKRLASASADKTVKVWDAQTVQKPLTLQGGAKSLHDMAFSLSPDGKRLAGGKEDDKALKVWDTQTGQELLSLKGPLPWSPAVAFSPDGKRLAASNQDWTTRQEQVKVWDAQTGQELRTLKGHAHGATGVAFSPDGKRLATGSWDNTVKVWDAQTGQELLTLKGHTGEIHCLAFSPDGKRLASGSWDRTGKVWDAQTGQELLSFNRHSEWPAGSMTFSPDGKLLAAASPDKTMKVWDAQTGRERLTLKGHTNYVKSVAFSPNGKRLVSASRDKTVKVWDAQTGLELLSLKGRSGWPAGCVAFSPDGQRLVSAWFDSTVRFGTPRRCRRNGDRIWTA